MKCLACNKTLNDRESTRKYSSNGTFVDLCDRCYSYVSDDIAAIDGEGYIADFPTEEEEYTGESIDGWEGISTPSEKDDTSW